MGAAGEGCPPVPRPRSQHYTIGTTFQESNLGIGLKSPTTLFRASYPKAKIGSSLNLQLHVLNKLQYVNLTGKMHKNIFIKCWWMTKCSFCKVKRKISMTKLNRQYATHVHVNIWEKTHDTDGTSTGEFRCLVSFHAILFFQIVHSTLFLKSEKSYENPGRQRIITRFHIW